MISLTIGHDESENDSRSGIIPVKENHGYFI